MSIDYKDLGLKKNEEFNETEIAGKKIQVKQYLDVDKKSSIVNLAVRAAVMDGYVHDILMDAYFHIMIIENYTNISFDKDEIGDVLKNFDELESSGTLALIIDAIEPKEYNSLYEALEILKSNVNEFNRSQAGAVQTLQELTQLSNQKQ